MLMFTFHIAFALGLIALTLGLFLKHCCRCCGAKCDTTTGDMKACGPMKCSCWCGLIIAILALLSLICTATAGFKYWKAGEFHMPAPMATEETIQMNVK